MRIVLTGGGKVGSYLARELSRAGHVVAVIEEDPEHAQELADQSNVVVLEGDGTQVSLLEAVDIGRADWLLGVTGVDEVNLVACELALTLGAKNVLARLNNPLNRPTFEALHIPVVAVTDLMATVISREVEVSDLRLITLLGRGRISLYEVDLPPEFVERPLAEVRFPTGSLAVAVVSGHDVFVPTASTVLKPGDEVTVVSSMEIETEVRACLLAPSASR